MLTRIILAMLAAILFQAVVDTFLRKTMDRFLTKYVLRVINTLQQSSGNLALSFSYFFELKNVDRKLKLILLLFIVVYSFVSWKSQQENLIRFSFIMCIFMIILIVKESLIEYRIRKGLFSTNRTEARELIDFIIKNSDNLDFTDSNGNLRRALLPEAKDATEERIPGTLGEEAPA